MGMIIEATSTYSPGNYQLLHYLLSELELRNKKAIVYLGHKSIYNMLKMENFTNITIEFSANLPTLQRFLSKRDKILFFFSLPPFVKQGRSLVYFHSSYIARPVNWEDKNLNWKTKIKRWLSTKLIQYFHKNVDYFAYQSQTMAKDLSTNYKGIALKQIPFFDMRNIERNSHSETQMFEYDFFYPATPDVHKNYFRFFDAVEVIAKKRKIKVCVTIAEHAKKYIKKIDEINLSSGATVIENIGRVSKTEVMSVFHRSKALFFPSLEESFGLPIVEAAWIGCPVLIANLPYAFDIIENPITFDPYSVGDMVTCMETFLDSKKPFTSQKPVIENKLDTLISYFDS